MTNSPRGAHAKFQDTTPKGGPRLQNANPFALRVFARLVEAMQRTSRDEEKLGHGEREAHGHKSAAHPVLRGARPHLRASGNKDQPRRSFSVPRSLSDSVSKAFRPSEESAILSRRSARLLHCLRTLQCTRELTRGSSVRSDSAHAPAPAHALLPSRCSTSSTRRCGTWSTDSRVANPLGNACSQ